MCRGQLDQPLQSARQHHYRKGPAFLSELWVSLAHLMGTTLHSTTAYNLTENGMVERVHCSLKVALMARCTDERWKEQLAWVLLGLCTALKANGEASSAEKVYGETLAVPREFFPPEVEETRTEVCALPQDLHQQNHHQQPTRLTLLCLRLRHGGHLPLTRPYRGPHRVIKRASKAFPSTSTGGRTGSPSAG
ncbi:uncharacterized protein [Macrobrachium rosenbergii]|uniref:uncharacterized protein n=1 Tax=Macrobrachium rosenbergii TaxID=79674 RepID=UPI0034D6CDEE